jgi:hypothetical protein
MWKYVIEYIDCSKKEYKFKKKYFDTQMEQELAFLRLKRNGHLIVNVHVAIKG